MSTANITFRRFLPVKAFLSDIQSLNAFGFDYVGESLLEELERHGLLTPRRRLHFPSEVARRLWYEHYEGTRSVAGALEPDGERWDAAATLWANLSRWHSRLIYGFKSHPLDIIDQSNSEFLTNPGPHTFRAWNEWRVDVSSNSSNHLFTSSYTETYYAPWQLLLACEIADVGLYYRINLLDGNVWDEAWKCASESKTPNAAVQFRSSGCRHAHFLMERENLLDAIVWFAEECDFSLHQIIPHTSGRYRLSNEESERYYHARQQIAVEAARAFGVDEEGLVDVLKHLINRWRDWNRIGRPLTAEAYKIFSANTANFLMLAFDISIEQVKERIGDRFSKIWPDWADVQRGRLALILRAALKGAMADESKIAEFAQFLIEQGLESFYWRLLSFEDQVFRGNEFSFGGMRSDLQGLAIAVEHVIRKLGGVKGQLLEMFKQLWLRRDVADLLAIHAWAARKGADVLSWDDFKRKLDEIRNGSPAGRVVADLLMAQRIRGTVHFSLPLNDDFEVEQLFVGLIRTAYETYVEVESNRVK